MPSTDVEQQPAVQQVRVRVLPDGRMSRRDAARYLGLGEKTLANWALVQKGPRPHRVGGRIYYFQHELDAFVRGKAA